MENTWLIGRTWKPREGWSRPVLTVERQHTHPPRQGVAGTNESITRTTGRHPARHMDQSFGRVHYPVPNPPHDPPREHVETRFRGMYNTRFAAAMAQGRRPDPFRTRKLRPGTAMVLHPEGCGRVARRRTKTLKGRGHHTCPLPFRIPGHNRGPGPDDHDRACRTRQANPIPGHTTPAHRDNPHGTPRP